MKAILVLAIVLMGQAAFADSIFCVYSDNKESPSYPNGAIKTVELSTGTHQRTQIVSLEESRGLINASYSATALEHNLVVRNSSGQILHNYSVDFTTGNNFVRNINGSSVWLICVPR